jgi:hypothetical protein
MKKVSLFCSFLVFYSLSYGQLNGPESIDYDPVNNRYLIANSANGKIMKRSVNGTISQFVANISPNPYGIEVVGNTVYACCSGKVLGFDLTTGLQVFSVNLGATFLNGITHDNSGNLFVTDFSAKKIYRIKIATQTFNVFAQNLTNSPNGIIFDEPSNSLVFVNWGSSAKIKRCSLADSSVVTILTTSYTNIDGIARKANGDFYISVWGTNSVYKYNNNFSSTPALVVSGLSSPADIYYNNLTDTLAIPNSGNNTLIFVGQSTVSLSEENFSEVVIYPNPSANLLFITSSEKQLARIELINESGIVAAIYPVDNALDVSIDIKDVEKGTYFVRLYDNKKILIGIERFVKVN